MPAAQKPPARRRMIHPSICLQRKGRMGGRGMVNACVLAPAAGGPAIARCLLSAAACVPATASYPARPHATQRT